MKKIEEKNKKLLEKNSYSQETFIAAKEAAARLRAVLKRINLQGIFSVQEGVYHGGVEIHVTFFSRKDLIQNDNSVPKIFESFCVRKHAPFYDLDEFYPEEFSRVLHPKIWNLFGFYSKKKKLEELMDANEKKWMVLSKNEKKDLIKKYIYCDKSEIYLFDINDIENYLE